MIVIQELALYLLYWSIFGITHSILATETLKSICPLKGLNYRIFYNLIATISLGFVILSTPSLTSIYFQIPELDTWKVILVGIFHIIGGVILAWGLLSWNIPGFLGLRVEDDQLNTGGPYQFSRHPVYSGILIILASLLIIDVSTSTLSWVIGAGGYFIFGTIPEENKLVSTFGDEYIKYRSTVSRLFPYKLKQFKAIFQSISG